MKSLSSTFETNVEDSLIETHTPRQEIARNMFNGRPMVELPGDNRTGGDFAVELGKNLQHGEFYRRAKSLVTLKAESKQIEQVGDQEFRTLIEKYVCLYRARSSRKMGEQSLQIRNTLTLDTTRMTIRSPQFLDELRELAHLHDVPLPVLRRDGHIELLSQGYDVESRTLTLNPCDFTKTICSDGAAYLRQLFGEFQFTEPERALSVAVAAMLTLFARRLLPASAHRPAFIYTANAVGGGKTLLADCAIIPAFGCSPRMVFPTREEETEKLLLAEIMAGSECLLFDNLKGRVDSPSIENLLTSHIFKGRILATSTTYAGDNNLIMFFTGNGVSVSEDLARRALFVELFQPEARAQDRQFRQMLSVDTLVTRRAEILAALWKIVHDWDVAGRPKGTRSHPSFPEWAATVGGMVEYAGFASPVAAPVLRDGGNQDTEDMLALVQAVRNLHIDRPISFETLADTAAEMGLFERITDCRQAATMDRPEKARFGILLKSYDRRAFGVDRLTFMVEGRGHQRRYRVTKQGE